MLALEVVGVGGDPQLDHASIGFLTREVGQQSCRLPHSDRQHACHRWIQSAAMANPADAQQPPDACDADMGGEPSRLVNDGKADGRSQGAGQTTLV